MSGLIILNTKIDLKYEDFQIYWKESSIRLCADGGKNRLDEYLKEQNQMVEINDIASLIIIGDMDSYIGDHSNIIKLNDQDTTDFTKCVNYLESLKVFDILVIGGYGGRLDHQCANLETIIKSKYNMIMVDGLNYVQKINKGINIF